MIFLTTLEKCMLSDNIMDYFFVAQGKTTIPGVDDAEECMLADVRNQLVVAKVSRLVFKFFKSSVQEKHKSINQGFMNPHASTLQPCNCRQI